MSNDLKLTQEKWNTVLDLKDMINSHSETINKLSKVINSQKQEIDEIKKKLSTSNSMNDFGDIFSDMYKGKK